jgi:hypothetical protein
MSNPASSVMVSTHFNHHSPLWTDSGHALDRGSYPLKKEAKGRDQTRRLESVDEIKQDTCRISGWDQTRNTWNQWLWTCLDNRRNFAKPRNLTSNEIYARYCGANLQQIDVPLFYTNSFSASVFTMNACDVQVFLYLPLWMVEVADRFQFSSFHRQHTVTTTTTTCGI